MFKQSYFLHLAFASYLPQSPRPMVLAVLSNIYKHTRKSYQRVASQLQIPEYFSGKNQRIVDKIVNIETETINTFTIFRIGESAHLKNIPILLRGKTEYIHTLQTTGENKNDDLVLVHGYGVGLMNFYKMLGTLSKQYKIWSIDLIGMGASSRPDFNLKTTEDTIDYFVESIEEWRKSVGLESFYMSGHSFGGYMVTWYALKYPHRVKKMMLLSPAGISRIDKSFLDQRTLAQYTWWRRQLMKYLIRRWNNGGLTPRDFMSALWFWRDRLLKNYLKRTHLKDREMELAVDYMKNILTLPASTQRSLHLILGFPGGCGVKPLEDHLRKLESPLDIYYGEYDWMNSSGALRASKRGDFRGKVHIIPHAGHVMSFDNPEYVANLMNRNKHN